MAVRDRKNYRLEIYPDSSGELRWRLVDVRNGEVVGAAHQGFSRRADCEHNFFINTGWTADLFGVDEGT